VGPRRATAARALRRLRYLGIDGNALTGVPDWIGEVASLVELRVQGNAITELPEAIGGLGALRELHTRGNRLTALPASIGTLSELRVLDLRWTPFFPDLPAPARALEARGCVVLV
jgi:Leucine-rich repeat (LRR) protein